MPNQNPEQIARDKIDEMLAAAGWVVQDHAAPDLNVGLGIALREYPTDTGPMDYLLIVDKKPCGLIETEEDIAATAENISQQTEDFILKELSKKTKGYPLENFVAALFNAMGYRTQILKKGGDRGTDIVAYKDELPPRIIVQVKSQDGDIPEKYVSQLGGTLKQGDYGVFVCLSDFSANARTYILENPHHSVEEGVHSGCKVN